VCGRYAATKNPATLATEFDAIDGTGDDAPAPDHNVAPTKSVISVVQRHPREPDGTPDPDHTERSLRVMRWGLVPHWAKERSIGSKMINARADTAATKPAFKTSLAKRRCLLPADGWFEWRRDGTGKQPFFMTRTDGESLALAGIWSTWHDPNGDQDAPPVITCAVLTVDSVGDLRDIHDRMPLLLGPDSWSSWLDPDAQHVDDIAALLDHADPATVAALELRPVSSAVNSVRNNGPDLVKPVELATELDPPTLFDSEQARR
jgi:putative SOS response-associated peptidase YedK